jgi:hypothetical protein
MLTNLSSTFEYIWNEINHANILECEKVYILNDLLKTGLIHMQRKLAITFVLAILPRRSSLINPVTLTVVSRILYKRKQISVLCFSGSVEQN